LAHANRFVQVPDVRWCSDSNPNTNANPDTYAYAYADTYSDPDSGPVTECSLEPWGNSGLDDSNQSVVDG
jgi:hypothetical protein